MNVPAPAWDILKALADQSGHAIVDELCRAIGLWHYVVEQRAQGGKVLVESGEDHQLRELAFLD